MTKEASPRYKKYLLTVLLCILALNLSDRLALGLVLQDIKADLKLSDTQLGLLTGIAFAFFYSVMGIPIARWADRGNRVTIISLTAALGSVMVAACGMVGSFVQLLLVRVGVAIGEAGCLPPSFSLISDYFKRAERPSASATFTLGAPLSFFLGYFPAGWLNEAYGWRMTFIVLGLPGLLLAALAWFTLKEPRVNGKRLGVSAPDGEASSSPKNSPELVPSLPMREVLVTLWRIPSFRHLLLCYSILYFFVGGILQWQPAFFQRSHGLSTGTLGTWFALIYGISGFIGTYLGGRLASRLASSNERLQLKATSFVYIALGFISVCIYVAPTYQLSFVALTLFAFGMHSTTGPLWSTIQTVVPEQMRATAIAIMYLFANLIGTGCGPLAVGVLSDAFAPIVGNESLRYALIVVSPGLLWGAWHIWRSSTTVARDIDEVLNADERSALGELPLARKLRAQVS